MKLNGLILAAGNSSRLGQPKQLLSHQGQSLLRTVEGLLADKVNQLFTVLGSQKQQMISELKHSNVIDNNNWQLGMGSSLRLGFAQASKHADAVLVALCDQPKISAQHYQNLIDMAQAKPGFIIASQYGGSLGVPVIFPVKYADDIIQIAHHHGAKHVIRKHQEMVIAVECEAAGIDIDTVKDLQLLL